MDSFRDTLDDERAEPEDGAFAGLHLWSANERASQRECSSGELASVTLIGR